MDSNIINNSTKIGFPKLDLFLFAAFYLYISSIYYNYTFIFNFNYVNKIYI